MYIELNVGEATIERILNKNNIIDTKEYGIIRINKQGAYWIMSAILGRGIKNRPELLWKVEVSGRGVVCNRIKTYKERIFLGITVISSLLVPIAVFALLKHLYLTFSNKNGMPIEALVGVIMYLLIITSFWGVYYYVFIKKSEEIIKKVINLYFLGFSRFRESEL